MSMCVYIRYRYIYIYIEYIEHIYIYIYIYVYTHILMWGNTYMLYSRCSREKLMTACQISDLAQAGAELIQGLK